MVSKAVPNPSLERVRHTRLADKIADQLRRYIAANEMSVGARLPSERQLADTLGTSRTTISQALRILAIAGLVEVRPGSGTYIRIDPYTLLGVSFDVMFDPDPDSLARLAEFRHWIEDGLFTLANELSFEADNLRNAFDVLARLDISIGEFIEADASFHVAIVAAAQNPYLTSLFEAVHRQILQVTYTGWIESGHSPQWLSGRERHQHIDMHRRIRDAALDGSPQELRGALDDHSASLERHIEITQKELR